MADTTKAVFLSYASEDAEAAAQMCAALRNAGIEVWFDQNELRGGDAWDAMIRRQIKTCALFIPIISRHTHGRAEGYFRLEWKLAVDRSYLIIANKPFLLPVVVDDIGEDDEHVPDKFREVQWTHLPGGITPANFVERIGRLLSAGTGGAEPHEGHRSAPPAAGSNGNENRVAVGTVAHRPASTRSPALWVIVALLVAVTGYWALDHFFVPKRAVPVAKAPPASASTSNIAPENSIAVLPFVNLSSDKDQEYFSDGLAEELLDMLAKTPGLHVIGRTSSFYFKGKQVPLAEIAKTLNVTNILEGSVRKSGKRMRITTELVRADSGEHLWSESYEREVDDVFKVQDEIATAVVAALKLQLAQGMQFSTSHGTTSAEAYTAFLLGRQFHNRNTLDGWRRAIDAFHKAIGLDPNYAAAYAGLSLSEAFVAGETGDAAELERARSDAEKAVAVGPSQADGYVARGYFRSTFDWDWAGAQSDLSKAITMSPGDGVIQYRYARLMVQLGRLPEALAASTQAVATDPLSLVAWEGLGDAMLASQDRPRAREAYRRALEIQPENSYALDSLGTLQLLEGEAADALATFRKIELNEFRLNGVAMAEYSLGNDAESQHALEELIDKHGQIAAYEIAEVYSWRHEPDRAFEWLKRAYQRRDAGVSWTRFDPLLEPLRGDPRYTELLRRLKIPV